MENDSRIRMSATHAKRVFDQYTIANSARCDVPLFEEISRRLKALVKLKPKLSADQMVRFETLRISDLDVVTDWLIGLAKSQQNPKWFDCKLWIMALRQIGMRPSQQRQIEPSSEP